MKLLELVGSSATVVDVHDWLDGEISARKYAVSKRASYPASAHTHMIDVLAGRGQ